MESSSGSVAPTMRYGMLDVTTTGDSFVPLGCDASNNRTRGKRDVSDRVQAGYVGAGWGESGDGRAEPRGTHLLEKVVVVEEILPLRESLELLELETRGVFDIARGGIVAGKSGETTNLRIDREGRSECRSVASSGRRGTGEKSCAERGDPKVARPMIGRLGSPRENGVLESRSGRVLRA